MNEPQAIEPGQQASQSFGENALMRMAETSSVALAEQAKAAVQARYIMALQRPRDLQAARQKLLADCKRPGFAATAIYNKPVGDGVEGPSIRMAEAAARAMGNVYCDVAAIYDDAQKRIVRVSVTDLEANLTYPKDVTIEKTIERSKPMPGRKILSTRKNSKGYDVYVIEATSDEILDKENALTSKAMRTCLLRIVPGDILEEAIEQCYRTRDGEISADIGASRKRMVDAFATFGVTAGQLAEYLGHPVDTATTEEMGKAKGVLAALKDKETTWAEVLEFAKQQRGAPAESSPTGKTEPLAQRMADRAAGTNGAGKPEGVKTSMQPEHKPQGQSRFEQES
jgi:hypothetical protein